MGFGCFVLVRCGDSEVLFVVNERTALVQVGKLGEASLLRLAAGRRMGFFVFLPVELRPGWVR